MGEGHHEKVDVAGVAAHETGQLLHLLTRTLARVGEAVEMHRVNAQAAPGHEVARNGRVDAARQHEGAPSA